MLYVIQVELRGKQWNRSYIKVRIEIPQQNCHFSLLLEHTFCATNISYIAQMPHIVMPCSLHNMAAETQSIVGMRNIQPVMKRSILL
jgi:hypothetical protein